MPNLDHTYVPENRTQAFENHARGYLISLAGPGTGKTTALLQRIQALTTRGVQQNTICYLTFIKEISNAFIQDYIEKFGRESYDTNHPRISTLHSFACRLLRHQGYRIQYDGELYFSNTAETNSEDSITILGDLLPFVTTPQCHTSAQLRSNIELIKTAWRDTLDPSTLPTPVPAILSQAANLFKAFRLVDWDQTIPLALALATDLQPLPDWIQEIQHYCIDEYQDFNKAEQALIAFLAQSATSIVIVGDDDQSLYSGRGGLPDGLRNLFANSAHDQVSLVRCFRCRESIVIAANTFQRTMHAAPRDIIPTKDNGQIIAYSFKSSKAEIGFLTGFLGECIANLPNPAHSKDGVVCLFPSWRVLDSYFEKLAPLIPSIRRKSEPNPNRIWLERILRLICAPNQRFLQRLLLNCFDQIKPRHKQLIVHRVVERNISVVEAIQSLLTDGQLKAQAAAQAQEFCLLIEHLAAQDSHTIAPHLTAKLGLDLQFTTTHVTTFIDSMAEPEKDDLITEYCDILLPDSKQPEEDPSSVLFLTIHSSKGLTKKNVVMPGLEAAWLPGAATGADLEERRRLFYVAITRATDCVLITYPRTRGPKDSLNFQTPGRGKPSPFIAEAGVYYSYHT